MTWIAVSDQDSFHFAPTGLTGASGQPGLMGTSDQTLMPRGSLVIETRVPTTRGPRQLVHFTRSDAHPLHLSLQAIPGGGLTLILDQGSEILHRTINDSGSGRADVLRITYSWDSTLGWGRLALERVDCEKAILMQAPAPQPLRFCDALALVRPGVDRFIAPEVLFMALSRAIEPVGPMPSLLADTPIATPTGYRPISEMQRGDTVITPEGAVVPVLQVLSRQVPSLGSYSPIQVRAPYFGLQKDITVAPSQRLVLSGSEVEYLFGCESVLVPARHLAGRTVIKTVDTGPLVTYWQLLLPYHEALIAAGTVSESMFIGRLRRQKEALSASLLAGLDRMTLPEHGQSLHPVLQAFEAVILAEQRVA